MAVIRQGSRVTFCKARKVLEDRVGSFCGGSQLGDEAVTGGGARCQVVALDRVEDADPCSLVALVRECLQPLGCGWVERWQDVLSGGGEVMRAAGGHRRGPDRETGAVGEDLDVPSVTVVFS